MQFITIRFLHFQGFTAKWNAFTWMGKLRTNPWQAEGLLFAKHLGTGAGNGFSIFPDWGTYAFLGLWNNEDAAQTFFSTDDRWKELAIQAESISGWDATPWKGHGTWNHKQPFEFDDSNEPWDGPVAVITRASIDKRKALRFWMNVPSSSRGIENQAGLLFAKGVGEVPLFEQATFSIWENAQALDAFAYRSRAHAPMIKKTRQYQWYSEEMFVRMKARKL